MNKRSRTEYERTTPQSQELIKRARQVMPGGDTRSVTYYRPYPAFVESASEATVTTADGDVLIDFLNNYTQSVLGHAPEPVVEAVCERVRAGNGVAAPTEPVVKLAEQLVERVPSVEQVRFGNSGTEATMNAIRAAIGWTGNDRICKVQGGYHGTHDAVEVGVDGPGREHQGIPRVVEGRIDTVAYNDTEDLKTLFEQVGDELACFIVEPILGVGGMIPATNEYLATARDLTRTTNTVLIFDEVMSFRLAPGGAQQRRGITPDLTAFGKLIGGGLPVGAFGGRADLMEQFHPESGSIHHSGTFNGNPATMVGGVATLNILNTDTIDTLNRKGDRLRERLQQIGDESPLPVCVTGEGSLFQIHFTDEQVTDAATATAGSDLSERLFWTMRSNGTFIAPRGMGNLSTPMEDVELNAVVDAFRASLPTLANE
jgi:glutamate-1-semialdehyde 2,1-aminomutase